MNARELYNSTIRNLPALDRLHLASLILDDLAASAGAGLDLRDDWSAEDIADLMASSANCAADTNPSDETNA